MPYLGMENNLFKYRYSTTGSQSPNSEDTTELYFQQILIKNVNTNGNGKVDLAMSSSSFGQSDPQTLCRVLRLKLILRTNFFL